MSNHKTVSQIDRHGYFSGPAMAHESPLEPGVWLIPGGCVDAPPPTVPDGQQAYWDGASFLLRSLPQPEPPTRAQIAASICAAVQQRLDNFARTIGYDNLLAACSYATSKNAIWQQDAAYCMAARDDTWDTFFTLMAADPPPDSYRDIEDRLPNLALPSSSSSYIG